MLAWDTWDTTQKIALPAFQADDIWTYFLLRALCLLVVFSPVCVHFGSYSSAFKIKVLNTPLLNSLLIFAHLNVINHD